MADQGFSPSFSGTQFLGDMLGGFQQQSQVHRQTAHDDAQRQSDRDNKIFEALANSDDPEIRSAAVTGLITGNHPARGLDKWLGKVGEHPAYGTIKGLLSEGHQPFVGTEEAEARKRAGHITGTARGAAQGLREEGIEPSQDFMQRVIAGSTGAAMRPINKVNGDITFQDGTTEPGYFDPTDGKYHRVNGDEVDDAAGFKHAGLSAGAGADNPNRGGTWTRHVPDKNSPTGYSDVHLGMDGKEMGRAPSAAPPPPPVTYMPDVNAESGVSVGDRSGTIRPAVRAGGGGPVQRPETQSQSLQGLRETAASIEKDANTALQKSFPGLRPSGAQLTAKMDELAKKYGYQSYSELQDAIGKASRGITTGPPPQAPKGAPAGKKKGAGGGGSAGSGLDVDKILAAAEALRKKG